MIKVNIVGAESSAGRGVGFYATNLAKALEQAKEIEVTDKDPDVIHYPFFDLFYPTLPIIKSKPTVVTIHDLTPLVMHERYPVGIKGYLNLLHQRLALSNVKAIITDSQHSKGDIVKLLNIDFEKVFVTPLAVDESYSKDVPKSKQLEVKKKYHLPEKFVLTLAAGPNPNKNLPALAEATKQLNIPLVLVGKGLIQELKEPVHPELIDLVTLKKYNHIIYAGFVSLDDFSAMLRLASVYCQPSLYEGFGLPLLEAMAAGCLVVSSNSSSLPEIYHKDAITFDPKNISEMRIKIDEALTLSDKDKKHQINEGLKRAADFDWTKTANMTVEVYKKVV